MTKTTTIQDLKHLSMTTLVDIYNKCTTLNGKPATIKTFNSKKKIINRIKFYKEGVAKIKSAGIVWEKGLGKTRSTITALANRLILDPEGYPYREILEKIKVEFPDASTNLNCLRWYAAKLRSKKEVVPDRVHGRTKL